MLAFARYIGIDYSGAQTPTASLPGLRVYLAEGVSFLRERPRLAVDGNRPQSPSHDMRPPALLLLQTVATGSGKPAWGACIGYSAADRI